MENENNNYSFTPITEDNSVNEIKDDFFGGSSPEPSTTNNDVPPILDVPEIKEEVTSVASPAPETLPSAAVTPENNVNTTSANINEPVPAEPVQTTAPVAPQTNIEPVQPPQETVPVTEQVNIEQSQPVPEVAPVAEPAPATPEPITEVNAPAENVTSEPVEVKIPEGLDEEVKEDVPAPTVEPVAPAAEPVVNNPEPSVAPSAPVVAPANTLEPAPVVEQPVEVTEPVNAPVPPKPEAPKKGRSIFDFFKNKETPTVNNTNNEPNTEKPTESDPFNNFVVDVPESTTPLETPIEDPVIANPESTIESPLPNIEEPTKSPQVEVEEKTEEVSLPSVEEPIPEPVFASNNREINNEEKPLEPEPVKEIEPVVKEVVVEKEKVILGKKCPNCGEVTAEPFCPNCGFLVE